MMIHHPIPTRNLSGSSSFSSSSLSFHRDSRSTISKPKIRIIHVFAPEIIQTDTANFRVLVQRLTGRQPDHVHPRLPAKSRGGVAAPEKREPGSTERLDVFPGLKPRERRLVKEEEQAGGYLKDFEDLDDGFTRELRGLPPPGIDLL